MQFNYSASLLIYYCWFILKTVFQKTNSALFCLTPINLSLHSPKDSPAPASQWVNALRPPEEEEPVCKMVRTDVCQQHVLAGVNLPCLPTPAAQCSLRPPWRRRVRCGPNRWSAGGWHLSADSRTGNQEMNSRRWASFFALCVPAEKVGLGSQKVKGDEGLLQRSRRATPQQRGVHICIKYQQ